VILKFLVGLLFLIVAGAVVGIVLGLYYRWYRHRHKGEQEEAIREWEEAVRRLLAK